MRLESRSSQKEPLFNIRTTISAQECLLERCFCQGSYCLLYHLQDSRASASDRRFHPGLRIPNKTGFRCAACSCHAGLKWPAKGSRKLCLKTPSWRLPTCHGCHQPLEGLLRSLFLPGPQNYVKLVALSAVSEGFGPSSHDQDFW